MKIKKVKEINFKIFQPSYVIGGGCHSHAASEWGHNWKGVLLAPKVCDTGAKLKFEQVFNSKIEDKNN